MGQPLSGPDGALRDELELELARLQKATPLEVLGLPPGAGAAEVRAAFLGLTKRLHPNRFARRDAAVVRLANEIFLLVRAAYERASNPLKAESMRGASELRPPTQRELRPPTQRELRPPTQRELRPPTARELRPPTARELESPGTGGARPAIASGGSTAAPRAADSAPPPDAGREGSRPPPAVAVPSGGIDQELRAAIAEKRRQRLNPPLGAAPGAARGSDQSTRTASHAAISVAEPPARPAEVRAPTREERMRRAARLLDEGQLAEARAGFRTLVAEKPDDVRARSFLHLAAGRELLAAGKLEEARVEVERAVAADPASFEARDTLADLAKKDGGMFSRWFRK